MNTTRPVDWLAFFAGHDLRPMVKHTCCKPGSNQEFWWDVGNGAVPMPSCGCQYPTSQDFRDHLTAHPRRTIESEAELYGKPVSLGRPLQPVLIQVAKHRVPMFARKRK